MLDDYFLIQASSVLRFCWFIIYVNLTNDDVSLDSEKSSVLTIKTEDDVSSLFSHFASIMCINKTIIYRQLYRMRAAGKLLDVNKEQF